MPEFRTTSQACRANADARRNALIGLVKNPAIANKVIATLGDRLPPRCAAHRLVEAVEGTTTGDLITISVRTEDPAVAMAIANAWGAGVRAARQPTPYGIVVESAEAVRQQAERAKDDYDTARAPSSPLPAPTASPSPMAIAETEQTSMPPPPPKSSRLAAFVGEHNEGSVARRAARQRRRLVRLLEDARALETQLATAGNVASPSDAVALTLQAQVYAWPEAHDGDRDPAHRSAVPDRQRGRGPRPRGGRPRRDRGHRGADRQPRRGHRHVATGATRRPPCRPLRGGGALDAVIAPLHESSAASRPSSKRRRPPCRELTQTRDLAWETYHRGAQGRRAECGRRRAGHRGASCRPRRAAHGTRFAPARADGGPGRAVALCLAVGVAFVTNLLHPDADPSAALKGRRPRAAALQ